MRELRILLTVIALLAARWFGPTTCPRRPNERLKLWSNNAPQGDGTFEKADATVTVHLSEKANGTPVVICPGGGYGGFVTPTHAERLARKYAAESFRRAK